MKKICENNKYISVVVSFLLSLLASTAYGMAPFGHVQACDQMWFVYGGLRMVNGGVIYKDFFDHKGPLLYFIQYLGQLLGGFTGVWILEIIFFAGALYVMWKIAELYTDNTYIIILSIIYIWLFYVRWNTYGDLTEEFALLPIAYSLFTYLRYIRQEQVSAISILLTGVSLGCVLCLRPNMLGVWMGMSLAVLFMLVKHAKPKEIFRLLFLFVVGISMVLVGISIYLNYNHAWEDMISQYLIFNFRYSSTSWIERVDTMGKFLWETCRYGLPFITVIAIISWRRKYLYFEKFGIYVSVICSVILSNWSGRFYVHYYEVLLPFIVIILVCSFEYIGQLLQKRKIKGVPVILGFFVLILGRLGVGMWGYYTYHNIANDPLHDYQELAEWVDERVTKNDSLYSSYGTIFYVASERFPTTKYHAFPAVDKEKLTDMVVERNEELINNPSEYILLDRDAQVDEEIENLIKNKYMVVDSYGDCCLFKYLGR